MQFCFNFEPRRHRNFVRGERNLAMMINTDAVVLLAFKSLMIINFMVFFPLSLFSFLLHNFETIRLNDLNVFQRQE
jgi:hypothetical protein